MKKFWSEFKAFISKGNILDLAIAVVIGGAFNKITASLVNDVIMPLISLAVGGANVTDWKWVIKEATYDEAGTLLTAETALRYGVFIQTIIDFLIIALTIFIMFKVIKFTSRKLRETSESLKTSVKKRKEKKSKKADGETVAETEEQSVEVEQTAEQAVEDKAEEKAKE